MSCLCPVVADYIWHDAAVSAARSSDMVCPLALAAAMVFRLAFAPPHFSAPTFLLFVVDSPFYSYLHI